MSEPPLLAPTLPRMLRRHARLRPGRVALRQKDLGIWRPVTWAEYEREARRFGLGLLRLGLSPGGHAAIVSENRKEWVIAQLGINAVGGVMVGVYPTSPAHEVDYLLRHADAEVVVCEDQEQTDKVLEVKGRLPALRRIVVVDARGLRRYREPMLVPFDEVTAMGARHERERPDLADALLERQSEDDIAEMIFTSGSTGPPKAAMISYRNINHMIRGFTAVFRFDERDRMLSYLPLCHVAEQIFSVYLPLAAGAQVSFGESLRTVQQDLREVAPTVFLGVPRIWEKLHSAIVIKAGEAGGARKRLFDLAMAAVSPFCETPAARRTPGQRLLAAVWHLVIFRALLNFTGLTRVRLAFSGAAPISPEVLRFFRTIGVPLREAYGMTEAAGVVTVQQREACPVGTVGSPVPGLEVRLAEDGELLLKGGQIFVGYYKDEAATRAAVRDGWLHTGDIAEPVDGELRIVDRKKDILITSGGKNVSPSRIENNLKYSPYIKEAIVIGEGRHYLAALIQIEYETVARWAEAHGIPYTTFRSLAEHPRVRELIREEVDAANGRVSRVQHVRRFHLLTKELDHDDGEVTATMKVRRKTIHDAFADAIEALYAGSPPPDRPAGLRGPGGRS